MTIRRAIFEVFRVAVLSSLLLAAILCGGSAWFGSRNAFVEYLNGKHVLLHGHTIDLAESSAGRSVTIPIVMTNATSRPIWIMGANLSCDCMVADSLPRTIPARAQLALNLQVHREGRRQPLRLHAQFLTDDPSQPRLSVQINAID